MQDPEALSSNCILAQSPTTTAQPIGTWRPIFGPQLKVKSI